MRVCFLPENKPVDSTAGKTILECARDEGYHIFASCAGKGTCGECRVRIHEGIPEPQTVDTLYFSPKELESGWRLACLHTVQDGMAIEIPAFQKIQIGKTVTSTATPYVQLDPVVVKEYIEVQEPTLEHPATDLQLVCNALQHGELRHTVNFLRVLPETLRSGAFRITCIHDGEELIHAEQGDTTSIHYGIALDIGTTTLAALLVDLHTGDTIEAVSTMNLQMVYGADVLSRIRHAIENPKGLEQLINKLRESINNVLESLFQNRHELKETVYDVAVAGNTTMQHFLLGLSPKGFAFSPYTPVLSDGVSLPATTSRISLPPYSRMYVLPNLGGYVGGDTVGMILSTRMDKQKDLHLGIDIGTNGEIVLGARERMYACAAAAGTAFEGGGLQSGMAAVPGAISLIDWRDNDLQILTVGNEPPLGLCGSGVIDCIALLLQYGIVESSGKMLSKDEMTHPIALQMRDRLTGEGMHQEFVIYESDACRIVITQKDVREIQLAKGAILAGIRLLLREYGAELSDITKVYLAGTFGNFLRKESIRAIGLIPSEIPIEKMEFVGNAACSGAKLALISRSERSRAEHVSRMVKHINLATFPGFQDTFTDSLFFPSNHDE